MRTKLCPECGNVNRMQAIKTIITEDGQKEKVVICWYCGENLGGVE